MSLDNKTLTHLIKSTSLVAASELVEAGKVAQHLNCLVTDVLIGRGLITESVLGQILSDYYKVPFINLKAVDIDLATINLIPENLASERNAVIFKKDQQTLFLAVEDPQDLDLIELVKKAAGVGTKLEIHVCTHSGIKTALEVYKQQPSQDEIKIHTEDIAVVSEIEKILERAARDNASDIHIEILEDRVLIRFRIDGVLHDQSAYAKATGSAFSARVKILANLKLDETRLPQDGQFSIHTRSGEAISFRVSILPTVNGEKIVLRLLENSLTHFSLDDLGFLPEDQQVVLKMLERIHGMCLVTGPTGSGKTTTLYTLLGLMNQPSVNIITIEDPVENRIKRINQTQVIQNINLTFANGLRSILRQDPDIIMVGEIRDRETAIIATNAAMTGHLVFSTVHANTASGALPRLIDLGVEPFLLASTINLVIAQRLVRVLCPKCKTETSLDPIMQKKLGDIKAQVTPEIFHLLTHNYKSVGCAFCYQTGFKGRVGIFELLQIDDTIKRLIVAKQSSSEIWQTAREQKAKSMLEDGIIKVSQGITTLEEVFRVITH